MEKIDHRKALKHLYRPSAKAPVIVDVPKMNFLMIDGAGDPGTAQTYADAVEALYAVSYTLKFMVKKGPLAVDYSVMPLEGLWWADDMSAFARNDRTNWLWTSMLMQPDLVTVQMFDAASDQVRQKKDPVALDLMRFESFNEGRAAQIMHIGSYADEAPTIAGLHDFIATAGLARAGKHHEIYLGDPRRTAPEKLKTIIRQPVA